MGKVPKAHGFTSYQELLDLLNARRQELGLSLLELDDLAGFCDGYCGHLFTPNGKNGRGMGVTSLPLIFGALGAKIVFDDEAVPRYRRPKGPRLSIEDARRRWNPTNDNAES